MIRIYKDIKNKKALWLKRGLALQPFCILKISRNKIYPGAERDTVQWNRIKSP